MQVYAVRATDNRGVVVLEWPSGDQLVFELSDAPHTALSMLRAAAKLFPTAQEYEQYIAATQAGRVLVPSGNGRTACSRNVHPTAAGQQHVAKPDRAED